MTLADLIAPNAVIPALKANSKKQALQLLAQKAADVIGLKEGDILEGLLDRERLGSTGVGSGIAIPHAKLTGIDRLYGIFARLDHPVDFDSIDDMPVDLICLLIAPEGAGADHLKALARVSRLLRDKGICEKLRGATEADALYALLLDSERSRAA
ncbi:MAG: PTS IIA-like nitrogen regulatory protein PtsN [Rhodospirillaceae bacterium]|nr:PTS IIA-like nitrogen regulatory protein PtsN [Rhodospirillaceae bacterium]